MLAQKVEQLSGYRMKGSVYRAMLFFLSAYLLYWMIAPQEGSTPPTPSSDVLRQREALVEVLEVQKQESVKRVYTQSLRESIVNVSRRASKDSGHGAQDTGIYEEVMVLKI